MSATIERAIEILRTEGLAALLSDTSAYLGRRGRRTYSRLRHRPDAPTRRVTEEDWDVLVILDACRFDQFQRLYDGDGRLEARASLGSCTPEFLDRNFGGETHHDTVYVTGNPMYRREGIGDAFHDVIDVWESGWDEDNRTVRPEEMVAATLDARETYPRKRIVSHFVQPHYPFIGERGRAIEERVDSLSGIEWIGRHADGDAATPDRATPWDLLEEGVVDEETVRAAYDENLAIALPHVERLASELDGRTVVTSDHGNLVGERVAPLDGPTYGHPPGIHAEGLRKVPWLVVEAETRREVRAESPNRADGDASDEVADRLADLGYAEM